uniref:Uncharacterized protein n=1 Tax=Arundo donax TaxID=35708 RepID=A0A0A9DYN1_ARUDO
MGGVYSSALVILFHLRIDIPCELSRQAGCYQKWNQLKTAKG